MSKRRNRDRQPNLPVDALQRAREQAGLPAAPAQEEEDDVETVDQVETPAAPLVEAAPKRQRKVGSAQVKTVRKRGETDQDKVKYLLEHPTRIVSEEELRAEYSHVLTDLRNMGLLAAVLIGVLVILAQFI